MTSLEYSKRPPSESIVRKCNEIKLEHFPQYRSLNGDSLRDDEAEIGAEATKPEAEEAIAIF